MKKNYSKPDILFESFTLNTNIAAGCELQPNTENDGCGVLYSGRYILFADDVATNCTRTPGNTGSEYYDQFCYHTYEGNLNVFFS